MPVIPSLLVLVMSGVVLVALVVFERLGAIILMLFVENSEIEESIRIKVGQVLVERSRGLELLLIPEGPGLEHSGFERVRVNRQYHVKLLLLQMPPQVVTWILRDVYIGGTEFTMNGKRMRLEKVVVPDEPKSPELNAKQDETDEPGDAAI